MTTQELATTDNPESDGQCNNVSNNNVRKRSTASRSSSMESISAEAFISEYMSSDELERLNITLTEASSGSNGDKTTLLDDMIQAQLALWTCAFSVLYSYAWMQHRKKFLICIFFIVPVALTLTCIISWLLGCIVILGRMFANPVNYGSYFDASKHDGYGFDRNMAREAYRQRSYSGTSTMSYTSDNMFPMPLCRRHSSYTSLNSRPPSRKMSHVSTICSSHKDD